MNTLDPVELFTTIAKDIPQHLHQNIFVTGSLAAAYAFQEELLGRGVNTKNADIVVHPAGKIDSCAAMAQELLAKEWTKTQECYPQNQAEPVKSLRAIRLYPPHSTAYFLEFLNLPSSSQTEPKIWLPLKLADGWYGVPSFRFMSVVEQDRQTSAAGLEYASPAMMALANLLAHRQLGSDRIESGTMAGILRSAKDLGRVLALAYLAGRDKTETWVDPWARAISQYFSADHRELARDLGNGLRELIANSNVLEEARQTTDMGLLNGKNVSAENLSVTGERLIQDVIEPVQKLVLGA